MSNGNTPTPLPTPEEVMEVTESVMEEQEALLEKLPFWIKALTAMLVTASLAVAIAACAAISVATGPAAPLAAAACAMAVAALVLSLVFALIEYGMDYAETSDIREKADRLEEMKAQLEGG